MYVTQVSSVTGLILLHAYGLDTGAFGTVTAMDLDRDSTTLDGEGAEFSLRSAGGGGRNEWVAAKVLRRSVRGDCILFPTQ